MMIGKGLVGAAPGKAVAHCRDCGAEIDRRNMFCDADRERRLAARAAEAAV